MYSVERVYTENVKFDWSVFFSEFLSAFLWTKPFIHWKKINLKNKINKACSQETCQMEVSSLSFLKFLNLMKDCSAPQNFTHIEIETFFFFLNKCILKIRYRNVKYIIFLFLFIYLYIILWRFNSHVYNFPSLDQFNI